MRAIFTAKKRLINGVVSDEVNLKAVRIKKLFILILILLTAGLLAFTPGKKQITDNIISYIVNPKAQNLQLYWKDDSGKILKSIKNLKAFVESKKRKLLFAMNGGMYKTDNTPLGLYIERQKVISPLNTFSGEGNFYLKPNGVFYLTNKNVPIVCKTEDFENNEQIKYATQSGPMLVIDGFIHPAFKQGSSNVHIRNGIGILADNRIIFAMSKTKINFFDFATFFKDAGCINALYLDGFVSRTYLPEQNWIQTDGNFGVMIGVTETIAEE